MPSWQVPALTALLIFIGYFIPAALGSHWSLTGHGSAAIWPAAGVAVAGLALVGLGYWPAVALGMLAAFQVTDNTHSAGAQIFLSLGKAAAGAAGALLLLRGSQPRAPGLRAVGDLARILLAACAAAVVSAFAGAAAFWFEGRIPSHRVVHAFITWFMGDVLGVLIFGSLLLSWHRIEDQEWRTSDWAMFAAALLVTGVATWLVYFSAPRPGAFYLFPILVWAAFTLRTAGATAVLAVMSILAVAGTSIDLGPFSRQSGVGDMMLMQQFLAVAALMTLLVAVVCEERRDQTLSESERVGALAASRLAELTSLYESAPIGLAFFDRNYRYLRINEELAKVHGISPGAHAGRLLRDIAPVNAQSVEPVIDKVFATGEAVRNFEVTGETREEPGVRRHWLTGFYPVKDHRGQVEAVGVWVIEISERKRAQEREVLLAREVDHRAKNLLAVVQSVVQLTPARDPDDLKEGIIGRIQSLARAHSLLADSRWDGALFDDIVREELAPYRDGSGARVQVAGPPLFLRPAAAQSLAMVLHELATNAAKYGSLSTQLGRLEVSWSCTAEQIELRWTERGGPQITAPQESGFGSKIMSASIERQLHGSLVHDWSPNGLQCTIRISAREALGANAKSPVTVTA